MSSVAVVGIGAGIGALFLCAACFVLFQIYKRKREHNREIAEIEQGFPPAHPTEITQVQGLSTCQLPFVPTYVPCGGWGALSSTETVYNMPAFAQVNNLTHPAFVFPEEQSRTGWSFPGRRPRIGRMPSKARKLQALSAIMESPRGGTPGGGSRNSPAATKVGATAEPSSQSGSAEQLITKPETSSDSPQIPPRSSSRPVPITDTSVLVKPLTREPSRPRTTRSKSLGTVSDPNKPNRMTTFAAAPGPAPSGPLPPLPPLPRKISRHSDYDPANRHSALGIPASTQNNSTSTSLASSPERNWERIISSEDANLRFDLRGFGQAKIPAETSAEGGAEAVSNDTTSRPARNLGHRRSLVCLSITSNGSNRNSCSSLASTLEKQANRLSIPQIITVDRVSMSRVSSSGSLSSSNGGVTVVGTPKRRAGSSRVSASGSPVERPRSSALRAVSGNSCAPQRPMKASTRNSSSESIPKWEKTILAPKHSILKGSPGARKGHRRQNCVRLSTLAPTVLGPRSRSTSPSLMDEILEESPNRRSSPAAEKHMNGDVTLRPRLHVNPLRLRASLTPSSPTLSMVAYQHEPMIWSGPSSRRASYVSQTVKSPLSREASLFSIPSLPSVSHIGGGEDTQQGASTPAIEFTRPSTEWSENERSPPFGLHVTPNGSKRLLYDPESSPLPSWSRKYDPAWPMLEMNPSASGQEYDPNRPISVYSSDEEEISSPDFPFAVKDEATLENRSSSLQFLPEEPLQEDVHDCLEENKENLGRVRSPFDSMPILRPHASLMEDLDPSLPSPQPSPTSSISKTPPLLCRTNSNTSTTRPDTRNGKRQRRRRNSNSPNRRSGGIEKPNKRISGPRNQPPKDVRKSIMALRRMNSSLQVSSSDEMGKASRRYLRLGREESPDLPFDFSPNVSDDEDDPPRDILIEEEESESKECRYVTYSPPKPALRLLTTLPTPRTQHLTVWDAGESYWDEQAQRIQQAITNSPIDTPTNALDRMLGFSSDQVALQGKEEVAWLDTNASQQGKEEEVGNWDTRKSRALETPKSTRSLYDVQGFLKSP